MRVTRLFLTLFFLTFNVAVMAERAMTVDQLNQWMLKLELQRMALDREIRQKDMNAICSQGVKYIDIFKEVNPEVDIPNRAFSAYHEIDLSIKKLNLVLENIGC